MPLKKSQFNIKVHEVDDGRVLLFNSLSTNLGIVDKGTWALYQESEKFEPESMNGDSKKHIETMKNYGFLQEESMDEKGHLKVLERLVRYHSHLLSLTIAPTLGCNMACPYCYEKKRAGSMSPDVMSSTIAFAAKYIEQYDIKRLDVLWYGGEPLLELGTIRLLSRLFISLCEEKGVRYTSRIVTNGSLLSYDVAKILKEECNVQSAQVTVDGLRETHNKRRTLVNGGDSFTVITDNIERCKELLDITFRVNVDKDNIEEIGSLIEYFYKERGWGHSARMDINPVDNQYAGKMGNLSNCFTKRDFANLNSRFLKIMYKSAECEILKHLYPKRRLTSCGAVQSASFVVDPDGDLYKCWNLIGLKEHTVGNVFSGPVLNDELITWMSVDVPETCYDCELLPLCQGGCPLTRLQNDNVPVCSHKALSCAENLKIAYDAGLGKSIPSKTRYKAARVSNPC